MNENSSVAIQKIVEMFWGIMQQAMRREPPFDNVAFKTSNYSYVFGNYLKIKNEIEEPFRKEIIEAITEKAKYAIKKDLMKRVGEFSDVSPAHSGALVKFFKLLEDRGLNLLSDEDIESILNEKDENIDVVGTVKKIFRESLPDFKYHKKRQMAGELKFKKKLNEESSMMVIVDTGTWRSWLHFLVGVDNPEVLIDINKVFLLSKNAFDFKNEKELVDVLSKAGVLINKIMRIMEENRDILY
jgi:hypothetical protein